MCICRCTCTIFFLPFYHSPPSYTHTHTLSLSLSLLPHPPPPLSPSLPPSPPSLPFPPSLSSGQERFQSITNRFYSDTHAVIIVYDITSVEAMSDLEFWVREVQYYLTQELENGMPVIIVGNKKDLTEGNDRGGGTMPFQVDFRQVQEVANSNGFMRPLECSAKTGANVKKIFHALATELVKRKGYNKPPSVHSTVKKPCACTNSS